MDKGSRFFSFEDVRKVEFALMTDLNRLRSFATRLGLDEVVAHIDESIQRVESRRFVIAVVGEFKRGKSTFINALLGKEILPADIMPTSATLNRVTYGLQPRVEVIFKDEGQGERAENVSVDNLTNYVTKLTGESEATAAKVKEAIVYYPIRFCQNNVHIYDTPGLNDDEAMTAVTLSVLPKVDAAIMVIMPDSPFSGYEGDFLSKLLMNELGSVIFVVTAMDRLRSEKDRVKALQGIAQRIKQAVTRRAIEQFGQDTEEFHLYLQRIGEPKVYGVSGYEAVQAKIDVDPNRLAQSGFPEFETSLEKFLSEDRGAVALKVISDRTITVGEKISRTIDIQQGALQMHGQEFHAAQQDTLFQLEALRQLSVAEMRQIESDSEAVRARVQEIMQTMVARMVHLSDQVIDETPLTNADLNRAGIEAVGMVMGSLVNKLPEDMREKSKRGFERLKSKVPPKLIEKGRETWGAKAEPSSEVGQIVNKTPILEEMSQRIIVNIQEVAATSSAEIQPFIQDQLSRAVERVHSFARAADDILKRTEAKFAPSDRPDFGTHGLSTGSLTSSLAVITELGKLWSSNHFVDTKNIAVGSVTSIGVTLGSGLQNLRFKLLGAQEERSLTDRVTAFKENYKQSVADEIVKQLEAQHDVEEIEHQIAATYEGLKRKLAQEVEVSIHVMEDNLADLQRKRERSIILKERDATELAVMRQEVQEILTQSYRLSDQLLHIIKRL